MTEKELYQTVLDEFLGNIIPVSYVEYEKYYVIFLSDNLNELDNAVMLNKQSKKILPYSPLRISVEELDEEKKPIRFSER